MAVEIIFSSETSRALDPETAFLNHDLTSGYLKSFRFIYSIFSFDKLLFINFFCVCHCCTSDERWQLLLTY